VVDEPEPIEGEDIKVKVIDDTPIHVLIKEVIREPRMHYFKVPKLGSYLAIRLEYGSCLHVESFEAGVINMLEV
jgi:hypothetical protein